jgi:hypothetical protein
MSARTVFIRRKPSCHPGITRVIEKEPFPALRTSKVRKALENVIEGDSEVRTYAVSNSTFHKIAAPDFARS